MSKNLLLEKRYRNAVTFLESKQSDDLVMGNDEYEAFLEEVISNLKKVKRSLRTRSKDGVAHRKEADRIQSAINAMKYLNSKNRRIINKSMLSEDKDTLTRSDIRNFISGLK